MLFVAAGAALWWPLPLARSADATLEAGNALSCPGVQVEVPVRLWGAPALGSLQCSVHWDPTVATFMAVVPIGLGGLAYPENFGGDEAAGRLTVSWDDPSVAGTIVPHGTALFALRLALSSTRGANCMIAIDSDPVPIELTDLALKLLEVGVEAGRIETFGTPSVTYVDPGYSGVPFCTRVDWPYTGVSGDYLIGCDAFATIGAASAAVAPGGTVRVAADASSGQSVTLTDVTVVLEGAAAAGTDMVVSEGGVLTGDGAVGDLTVESGGTVSPGFSPGTIHAGNATWAGGGAYLWEVNDATGMAGRAPGWDLLDVAGTLNITATAANPFTVEVSSLTLGNVPGLAANFDDSQDYLWPMATASAGVTGFAPAKFKVDTTGFQPPTPGGAFSLALEGNSVNLVFTHSPPTAVRLISFSSVRSAPDRIEVRWTTGVEYDLIGFHVERLDADGAWRRVVVRDGWYHASEPGASCGLGRSPGSLSKPRVTP